MTESWEVEILNKMGKKKLFLIGNGFDIAHGLETRYSDLMKFIKEKSLESDERVRISETRIGYPSSLKTIEICVNNVKSSYLNLELREDKFIASDSSIFFNELIKHHDINKTWGNIENIYFECFKKYVENPESLVIINKELDHLKDFLTFYLEEIEKQNEVINYIILNSSNISEIISKDCQYKDIFDEYKYDNFYFISFNYTSRLLKLLIDKRIKNLRT